MQETVAAAPDVPARALEDSDPSQKVVSTHVLVDEHDVERLRELSRKTRVAQSEYLREAVDDLLTKYNKPAGSKP